MSHFSKVKTVFLEDEHLRGALSDLGCGVGAGKTLLKDYDGNMKQVDFAVSVPGCQWPIGFIKSKTGYEMVVDWYFMPIRQEDFVAQIAQKYAYRVVCEKLLKQGFAVKEDTQDADQTRRLVFERA